MKAFQPANPIFHDDKIARMALEAMRWPDGPVCPKSKCAASGLAVAKMGGVKQSHRDGLYRCKICRGQFTVTVGTIFASSKVPLRKWLQAAHLISSREQSMYQSGRSRPSWTSPTRLRGIWFIGCSAQRLPTMDQTRCSEKRLESTSAPSVPSLPR
jgi:transposase-like protein